jgi:hypothetical protein
VSDENDNKTEREPPIPRHKPSVGEAGEVSENDTKSLTRDGYISSSLAASSVSSEFVSREITPTGYEAHPQTNGEIPTIIEDGNVNVNDDDSEGESEGEGGGDDDPVYGGNDSASNSDEETGDEDKTSVLEGCEAALVLGKHLIGILRRCRASDKDGPLFEAKALSTFAPFNDHHAHMPFNRDLRRVVKVAANVVKETHKDIDIDCPFRGFDLCANGFVLAGGAPAALLLQSEPRDYDLFCLHDTAELAEAAIHRLAAHMLNVQSLLSHHKKKRNPKRRRIN